MRKLVAVVIVILIATMIVQHSRIKKLNKEVSVYMGNTNALMSDIEKHQIDSSRIAHVVKGLQLTLGEYEEYRAEDRQTIKNLKLKIKDIEATAKTKLEIKDHIVAALEDTIILRDSMMVAAKKVQSADKYTNFTGIIVNDSLEADYHSIVELNQTFYTTYKWKFLWFKGPIKDVRQVIITPNKKVELKYSEYIKIR